MPLVGATNRYHTLLPRLPLPHRGVGSENSTVAPVVSCVPVYGAVEMTAAATHESLNRPAASGAAVRVTVGVGGRVLLAAGVRVVVATGVRVLVATGVRLLVATGVRVLVATGVRVPVAAGVRVFVATGVRVLVAASVAVGVGEAGTLVA